MTPQRFGKQLFATTTFCTWLEASDTLGSGELHQSLPSQTGKKKQHLESSPCLKTQQSSDEEKEVFRRHSEMFNNLWDLIGPDFLQVGSNPKGKVLSSGCQRVGNLPSCIKKMEFLSFPVLGIYHTSRQNHRMAWVGLGILQIWSCLDIRIHSFNPTKCKSNGQGKNKCIWMSW